MDHHLLAKLWDDTLAGPMPDLGLGNYSTRPSSSSSSPRMRLGDVGKEGGQQEAQGSIMTMRRPPIESGNNPMSESPPVSPAGSLSPCSEKVESGRGDLSSSFRSAASAACQKKRASRVGGSGRGSQTVAYHV